MALPFSGNESSDTRAATVLLLVLLVADIAFVLAHYLLTTGVLGDALFSLELDRGYAEFFQYAKVFSIAIMLLAITARSRVVGYGVWALLFLYLLIDDAFQIHEDFGGYLASTLEFAPAGALPYFCRLAARCGEHGVENHLVVWRYRGRG